MEKMNVYDKLTVSRICDKSSALYSISYMSGSAIAPLIGGVLDDHIGFRYTSDIMAIMSGVLSILYLIVIATILASPKEVEREITCGSAEIAVLSAMSPDE